ncbi:hypothetical protein [Halolactibacillus sp. JCM 19043]|uniref:hypothetical protein n=1 Tax=Halolactibacillus sp. JCM 19043 TaxID=1460638 RepID=UPI0007830AC0|nr:hypothetical protein [Halolactibacillus sp. JCM 19043]
MADIKSLNEKEILERMERVILLLRFEDGIISNDKHNPSGIRTAQFFKEIWEKELKELRETLIKIRNQM